MTKSEIRRALTPKRIIIILTALLLAIAITLGIVFAIRNRDEGEINYLNADLSEYIGLSEEHYKNINITVPKDNVGSDTVDSIINALLTTNRASRPENNGGEVTNVPISLGDKAYLYYRVTVDDEKGRAEIVSPGAALSEVSAYNVGSGAFMPKYNYDRSKDYLTPYAQGFDGALIGAVPSLYKLSAGEMVTSGYINETDTIVFSYTEDGVRRSYMTTAEECSSLWGEGLFELLSQHKIGENIGVSYSCESGILYNIKVEYVLRAERAPLTVEIEFPSNYFDASLRGAHGRVEVWFRSTVVYNVPEYNSEFITDVLGVTAEELSSFEGDDPASKYREMLRAECEAEAERVHTALVEEAIWDELVKGASIKKLPSKELERSYNEIYSELYTMYYNVYSAGFDSPEEFCAWYYGLDSTSEVSAHVYELSERGVTEKLIFYYIARTENLLPSGEELKNAYDAAVDEYLNFYVEGSMKAELDALSGEERERRITELRAEMIESFGEEYFTEIVYYEAAFAAILEFATIG